VEKETISFEEFKKLNLITAKILEAVEHPDADRLLVLKIDLGEETRQIVAGIKTHYNPEELVGRQVVVVENLAPAVIRGVESRGMLLAVHDEEKLSILEPDREVKPGSVVS